MLEFQITSNVRLNNLSDLDHHPLKQYLREGIRCVQGTDGGALYGTNSIDEELSLEKMLGLSHEELCQMRRAEAEIERESMRVFAEKTVHFEKLRDGEEIRSLWYSRPMAPEGVRCWNPAFDVTDHELLTAIVTDRGIVYPPFDVNLKKLFD